MYPYFYTTLGDRGSTVVTVLCYKSEGRWFDTSCCHWHKILPIALWPWGRLNLQSKWVPGAFPGGKGGRCVGLTTLPPFCALVTKSGNLSFLENSGQLRACNWTALQLGCHPVAVVNLHVNKTWNWLLLNLIFRRLMSTIVDVPHR